jgi:ribonuclease HII
MVIVGIDEVGRGCWAGPLLAGAVVLSQPIEGLKDSKQLSKKKREELSSTILNCAAGFGIGWVKPSEIDEVGLTEAVHLAMRRALDQIVIDYDKVIIDGNFNFLPDEPRVQTIIKADNSVPAVSAASIIAKVARDNYMTEIAAKYNNYGFESHVGYGTAHHLQQLKLHGICDLHRRSFKPIKALLQ